MFFVKQKTAYELRISDWSSDVCSSYPAVLEIRHTAPAQMVFDHPQPDIIERGKTGILDSLELDAVFATQLVAIVSIDQHIAPQHQRIAATFGQQAMFEIGRASRRERVCQYV